MVSIERNRVRDSRVQAAIDHWAPRFVANGVDMNDFFRITAEIERWDDWCATWSTWGAMHAELGDAAERDGFYRSAGDHYRQAAMLYHFGKFLFLHRPDELLAAHAQTVRWYRKGLPYFDYPGDSVHIPYEDGATIPGILRKPHHIPKPPIVILVPGLDSVKEELHAYGDDYLRRGMAVLAIDGPGQGEMEFDHPIRYDYEVPVRYVVDFLETRLDVDSDRAGLMGVSLGGYYAVRAATYEPRLKGVVAVATGYRLAEYYDGQPELTRDAFVHRMKVADRAAAKAELQKFDLSEPIRHLQAPLLVVMGRQDRLFPAESNEEMVADSHGKAELLMYEDGNHVCNNIPYRYRPQQTDWMSRRLGA
jgi:dienelactone hydrolase